LDAAPDKPVDPGHVIRQLRQRSGWSLAELAKRIGVAPATVSKLETGHLAVSLNRLIEFSRVFGVDISYFISEEARRADAGRPFGRRAIEPVGGGKLLRVEDADLHYLAADLLGKKMVPIVAELHARTRKQFGQLLQHGGEEFLMVLEGACELRTELYAPVVLQKGQSVYFDSSMKHGYVAAAPGRCTILTVCSAPETEVMAAFGQRSAC
jgi:transcriptional regulator with XRE-family HTH domain